MNKFIVRLPGGSQPKKAAQEVSKKKESSIFQTRNNQCTQVYLDMGQKSLGKSEKCPICDMVFIKDDAEDVRSHTEFCRQVAKIPTIPSLSGHNVVSEYRDRGEVAVKVTLGQSLHKVPIEEAIAHAIHELGSSPDLVCEKDIIYFLLNRKGSVLGILVCELVARNRCATIQSHEETADKLIVRTHELLCEEPTNAKNQFPVTSNSNIGTSKKYGQSAGSKRKLGEVHKHLNSGSIGSQGSFEVCGTDTNDQSSVGKNGDLVLMGVKLVWVVPSHRRQSIACRLLDTARRHFMYGTMVSVDCVVFSQPTEAGFAFASRYCQRDTVQAYA